QNGTVQAGLALPLSGQAARPQAGGGLSVPIPCNGVNLLWVSSDPSDIGFPASGCNPIVTFVNPGPRTINLFANDPFGETGAVLSWPFTVAPQPANLEVFITQPANDIDVVFGSSRTVTFVGGAVGGTPPLSSLWLETAPNGDKRVLAFGGSTVSDTFG